MHRWFIDDLNRREFIKKMALTGAAAYLGFDYEIAAADLPPETTSIRFFEYKASCWVPQYLAEDLLRKEGFTDIQYIKGKNIDQSEELLQAGEIDFRLGNASWQIKEVEPGDNAVFLAGLHAGCFSLIGSDRVHSIQDLKGKNDGHKVNRGLARTSFFQLSFHMSGWTHGRMLILWKLPRMKRCNFSLKAK